MLCASTDAMSVLENHHLGVVRSIHDKTTDVTKLASRIPTNHRLRFSSEVTTIPATAAAPAMIPRPRVSAVRLKRVKVTYRCNHLV